MLSGIQITSLAEFVRQLEGRKDNQRSPFLYRGHSSPGHALKPSLFRKAKNRQHERNISRELLVMQPDEFQGDNSVFERLVRMQHYSLPTRLLDITQNPLCALYFACKLHPSQDGELIRLRPKRGSIKYFDSDTVSCVANLSNLSGNERDLIRKMANSVELNESGLGRRLLHYIKAEKPYFEPLIRLEDLKSVIPVRPRRTNRRILAQQGAFLLFGLNSELADDNGEGIAIQRSLVPAKHKVSILRALDRCGINESTMFPEVESAAKYIMDQINPDAGAEGS